MNGRKDKWAEIVMFLIHLTFLIELVLVLAVIVQDRIAKLL